MAAVPAASPADAVISVDPSAKAPKRPARSIVPTSGLEDDQVTLIQSISLSRWSKTVAVNARVSPGRMVAVAGSISMRVATGDDATVTVAVPVSFSAVAVIVAIPSATALKSPSVSMVPTASSSHDQFTAEPALSCRPCTVNCRDSPAPRVIVDGETTTPEDAVATVTVASPVMFSAVAVMVVVPSATALKSPSASMVPTAGSLLVQAISMPENSLPNWSRAVAVNAAVSLETRVISDGVTAMLARAGSLLMTVTVASPVMFSAVAATVAVPSVRATKTPSSPMAPTVSSLLVQLTETLAMVLPSPSRAVTTNRWVSPIARVAPDGVI